MLFLSKTEIEKIVDYKQIITEIEKSHLVLKKGNYYMPERPVIEKDNKTVMWMPCFQEGMIITKMLTLFPENQKIHMPMINGLMIINNLEDGKFEAVMDATLLTALRTGAAGSIGIKYLSHKNYNSVGVVGFGTQGFYQLVFACIVRKIKKISIFDRFSANIGEKIEKLKKAINEPEIEIIVCETIEQLLENSQIVITATTSVTPVLPDNPELLKGKCYIAIGSYKPHVRELPDALWKVLDAAYTEFEFACEESGDILLPIEKGLWKKEEVKYICDLIESQLYLDNPEGKTILYKSVGMSLYDWAIAKYVYDRAFELGLGTNVEI
ncbi:MAG TPA: ornithine cyclodeaminase family protein [Sedimentibacter sp.]|nr:ornithine cyclodeaminase family protein [Sedimentibacter sp.]